MAGTIVLKGGKSNALFEEGDRLWRVREGEEVVAGVRLLKVSPDGVIVEQDGTCREFSFTWESNGSHGLERRVQPGFRRRSVNRTKSYD